eukprot:TRINITY_DN11865_c0_g1_i2.p2 TRINITY_DN11865_c0_g1~~TRINITY_DN11865_c0_g1_i2.p2  ORF type:complete len:115 (-),score=6.40 TRINITY_DN11865_c0_g1_i2:110-454(-)
MTCKRSMSNCSLVKRRMSSLAYRNISTFEINATHNKLRFFEKELEKQLATIGKLKRAIEELRNSIQERSHRGTESMMDYVDRELQRIDRRLKLLEEHTSREPWRASFLRRSRAH